MQVIEKKKLKLNIEFDGKPIVLTNLLPDLVYISAAFHDLGKATRFFQDYIRKPEAPHDKRKSHALISAVFVYYVAHKHLETKNLPTELSELLSIFCFSAVKRHHGRLKNLKDEILIEKDLRDELLPELAQNIDQDKIQELIDIQLKRFNFTVIWADFFEFIHSQKYNSVFDDFSFDFLQDEYQKINPKTRISLYYSHHLIYSALLFGDKNEVILNSENPDIQQIPVFDKIKDYRERKGFNNPKTEINRLQNEAFTSSVENLEKIFDKNKHVYSVTLPTGIGKTITAYNLADKLRKLSEMPDSKIIINIPFTSIIDQNFDVYSQILETNDTTKILKHHHLAEPKYKESENVSANYNQSKFLIETWQSDTVVTTFVQFLETILDCDKTKLMKFSHLANSIVLLDEIQTVPYEYWETIRDSFNVLGETLNIYFILISATQPLIFSPGMDIIELVPDYKKYFRFFNRTRLIIKGKISFDNFKSELTSYINTNKSKDILVILNTKNAALETFKHIKENCDSEEIELYFLTTLITPYERKIIIKRIKEKSQKQKIVISTQLVEAGVDISVHTVFRQIAPIDSIIQAAGRANRYDEKGEISDVFVYDINEYKKSTNLVYGTDLIIKTENVLANFKETEESKYLQLIENYFLEVRKQSDNTSQPILKAIKGLNFAEVNFKLIENRETESVYVQLNERAETIWNEYVQISEQEELKPWERDELFSEIKAEFYDYVINVPLPFKSNKIEFDSEKQHNFYVSKLYNPSKNYSYNEVDFSKNTGYIPSKQHSAFL